MLEFVPTRCAARASEIQPDALDPARGRELRPQGEGFLEHAAQAQGPGPAIRTQPREHAFVRQSLPYHRRRARDDQQIGQRDSGPGRAQYSQPGGAIAQVQQRADQHHQVAHHGAILQQFDVHSAKRNAAPTQGVRDVACMRLGAHQDGNVPLRVQSDLRPDGFGNRRRLPHPRRKSQDLDSRVRVKRGTRLRLARTEGDGTALAVIGAR